MLDNTADTVVVAVAAEDAEAATAYVVADVRRRGGRVRVVHVVPALELPGVPDPVQVEGGTLRRAGSELVDPVAATLEHQLPDTTVVPTVLRGPVVSELVRSARGARGIVVQRRRRGRRRAATLSTASGVAAHATVPVVVVPAEWAPDPEREPLVTVGVDDVPTAPHLLDVAVGEVRERGGRLRIVHVWHYDDTHEDLMPTGEAARAYEDELRRDLERELGPQLRRHPDLPVELVVRHAHAADTLTEESEAAGLLVLGRHRPLVSWGPHLGSVVRAVLREAACPVMVVEPAVAPPAA